MDPEDFISNANDKFILVQAVFLYKYMKNHASLGKVLSPSKATISTQTENNVKQYNTDKLFKDMQVNYFQ
jgi:hypothetical protein